MTVTALAQDNTRIWQTYYEPKPLSQLYSGWQEMLAEHRQIVVQVQEIAEETGSVRSASQILHAAGTRRKSGR
jgi:hypothetical protein